MKAIVLDIEGTTSPIDFVHKTLFPYALSRIENYVLDHLDSDTVQDCLEQTRQTVIREKGKDLRSEKIIVVLKDWIQADRKHPALKTLQGLIWEAGYESHQLRSVIYGDVPTALAAWKKKGFRVGIYSSGSVLAQKLIFKNSDHGDLGGMLDFYFDTAVGPKRETASYLTIAKNLDLPTNEILFASDVVEELLAARSAGMMVAHVVREGTVTDDRFKAHSSLLAIDT